MMAFVNVEKLLEHFGEPLQDEGAILATDLPTILAEIYSAPYEAMCLADHREAETADSLAKEHAVAAAAEAFKRAWTRSSDTEFCGLVSDDVRTLVALLASGRVSSSPFRLQRLAWYERGRFPCGYRGEFPIGQWVVA